jgi:hypothetical protein
MLPFFGSLAVGAPHAKLDVDLRIAYFLGIPSAIQYLHDYYPFVLKDGEG